MAYTIAAYWNSSEIQSTLNAVSAIMYGNAYGSDYGMLLNIMGTFGLLAAMFAVWIKLQPSEAGNHLFVIILVYFGLFVPRVQVVIEERAGTVTGGPVSVDNVPLALAAFASFATQSGDWLRQAYETVFQPVDALRFGPNGMVFGSRVIDASRGIGIADPALDRDMMNFVRECVNPDFSSGYYSITDFVREPDLWSAIQNTYVPNPGRAVLVRPQGNPSAAPDLFNCQEAVTQLNDYLRVEATNRLGYLGRVMFPQLSAANANTSIAAALPAAEGALLASSQDAATSVLQKMMINLFRDATQSIPATLNNPAAVQAAVGQAMAEQEALSSYRTMAKLADETLPSLRNAVQIVLFALFPLVIPICLLAGAKSGGKAFMTYALLLFWVELWPLLYAIVNFIRTSR
ncbi:MAG: conjugal transfer protein TraG N-terminal domain-containing protein, partial [Rhodocyclaceae bacterium]|nr:conjugal transfer protein TraG N-terminal domain-containing protein [Rhodocyclaceae bacterium]